MVWYRRSYWIHTESICEDGAADDPRGGQHEEAASWKALWVGKKMAAYNRLQGVEVKASWTALGLHSCSNFNVFVHLLFKH